MFEKSLCIILSLILALGLFLANTNISVQAIIPGEDTVIGEDKIYVAQASVETSDNTGIDENGEWYLLDTNVVYFVGKLSEEDDLSQYLYYQDTGEIEEVFWQ